MKIRSYLRAGLVLGLASVVHADSVLLDFETAGQYPDSFRALTGGAALSQTDNGASNDFLRAFNNGTISAVYDANGSAPGISTFSVSESQPLTISADVSFNVGNNSFGIYIINAANEAEGFLAIFNVNSSGGNDSIRFASNAVPTTAGAGTLVAGSFANNADVGIGANGVFNNITLTYGINGSNNPTLMMTAGGQTSSISLAGITPFTEVEVGFRFGAGSGTVGMDNLSIVPTSVPEPSSYAAAAGLATLGFALRRRRATR